MDAVSARDAVFSAYAESLIKFKARQITRKSGFTISDLEDVEQELTACLLAQAHHFDPELASANTFADRVIRSVIAMLLRSRRRKKRAAGFAARSLDRSLDSRNDTIAPLRDVVEPADLERRTGAGGEGECPPDTRADVNETLQSLTPELRDICARLVDGSAASVARDLGISRRRLGYAIELIRRRFQAVGLGER